MPCYLTKLKACVFTDVLQRAADGTPCSSGKSCREGKCVSDSKVPKSEGTCMYGEWKGDFSELGDPDGPKSCQDVMDRFPWKCYEEPYKSDCCKTCPMIKQKIGTENGKMGPFNFFSKIFHSVLIFINATLTYHLSQLLWTICSDPDKSFSSSKFASLNPNLNARTAISSRRKAAPGTLVAILSGGITAVKLAQTLVISKSAQTVTSKDCPSGDQPACASLKKYQCYDEEQRCCITCPKLKNSSKVGCEYGDKARWCADRVGAKLEHCPHFYQKCCESCQDYIRKNKLKI
ncbi:hypothetical protein HELRODRAFT_174073 [Helobdella robusta]|uniref:Uncharacterized protein n=1 Tax=Helobdella robusta TaxID=6412 RepID=T1F7K2_HELRO|nr:hypothetical protein HELRODRAFT_174073 [Helobdella robusta]ESO03173.1 hypothetical protein HELRODRAFT_174073 [Helobdella robusta]